VYLEEKKPLRNTRRSILNEIEKYATSMFLVRLEMSFDFEFEDFSICFYFDY